MALKSAELLTVTASTETDLVSPAAGATAILLSLTICNYDTSSQASIELLITDGTPAAKAQILKTTLDAGRTLFLDNLKLVAIGNATAGTHRKFRVKSSVVNTSFVASYDES